jgi:malate dehydrogenase (oxaloacetate-decarboxylating)
LTSLEKDAINLHQILKGKIEIHNRVSIDSGESKDKNGILELIYTPGVAFVAKEVPIKN